MKKKPADLKVGSVICDMHDGFKDFRVDGQVAVFSHIKYESQMPSIILVSRLRQEDPSYDGNYTNKLLVVFKDLGSDLQGARHLLCLYAYDDVIMGVVNLWVGDHGVKMPEFGPVVDKYLVGSDGKYEILSEEGSK